MDGAGTERIRNGVYSYNERVRSILRFELGYPRHPVNESDSGSTSGGTAESDESSELLAALRQRRRTNIALAGAVAVTLVWGLLWLMLGDKERGLSPLSKAYYFGRIGAVPVFALLVVGIASAFPGRNWFRACVAYVVIMLPGLAVVRTTFGLIEDQKQGERVGDPARSGSPAERRFRLRAVTVSGRVIASQRQFG